MSGSRRFAGANTKEIPVQSYCFCPACGKRLRTSPSLAGKKAQCPDCRYVFSLPNPPAVAPIPVPEVPAQPVRPVQPVHPVLNEPLGLPALPANHLPNTPAAYNPWYPPQPAQSADVTKLLRATLWFAAVVVVILILLVVTPMMIRGGRALTQTVKQRLPTAAAPPTIPSALPSSHDPLPVGATPTAAPSVNPVASTAGPAMPGATVPVGSVPGGSVPVESLGATGSHSVEVETNLRGSTVTVRDASGGGEVARQDLTGGETQCQFQLEAGREYEFEAKLGKFVTKRRGKGLERVLLNFQPAEIRDVCRMATCLIKLPQGGFGSGFLFGNRQTIVTAAHVLAAKTVGELELVFEPAEREEKYSGAQLIYFDAEQDVALLHLPSPVAEERPFLQRMDQNPDALPITPKHLHGRITCNQ